MHRVEHVETGRRDHRETGEVTGRSPDLEAREVRNPPNKIGFQLTKEFQRASSWRKHDHPPAT